MSVYYNEFNLNAADWLENLIDAGKLPKGIVDRRNIWDIRPKDLDNFSQCHFFAGIGIWPLALQQAGWPDEEPVWTGSCPCQPFSQAGKGLGFSDERHAWPAWFHLIDKQRPRKIFGEQVASSNSKPWLDLVCADLEGLDFAFGAKVFPAASVGELHKRERTFFFADAEFWGVSRRRHPPIISPFGQRGPLGKVDLQSVIKRPFNAGQNLPQPLIRASDYDYSRRLVEIQSFGNAIVAEQAKIFIESVMDI